MAKVTVDSTSEIVMEFIRDEIMSHFVYPNTVVSDNSTCDTANKLLSFFRIPSINWKTVL